MVFQNFAWYLYSRYRFVVSNLPYLSTYQRISKLEIVLILLDYNIRTNIWNQFIPCPCSATNNFISHANNTLKCSIYLTTDRVNCKWFITTRTQVRMSYIIYTICANLYIQIVSNTIPCSLQTSVKKQVNSCVHIISLFAFIHLEWVSI